MVILRCPAARLPVGQFPQRDRRGLGGAQCRQGDRPQGEPALAPDELLKPVAGIKAGELVKAVPDIAVTPWRHGPQQMTVDQPGEELVGFPRRAGKPRRRPATGAVALVQWGTRTED